MFWLFVVDKQNDEKWTFKTRKIPKILDKNASNK